MAKNQNRKNRMFSCVLLILVVSLLVGAILYRFVIKGSDFPNFKFFAGWIGLLLIVAFDIFTITGIIMMSRTHRVSRKPRNRMNSIRLLERDTLEKKESVFSDEKARPSGEVTTSIPKENPTVIPAPREKASSKKKPAMDQIDLNIRPFEEKDFDVMRNILATASSIILGTRKEQQDALYVSDTTFFGVNESADVLGIVCDGMGGLANGAEASKTAVRTVRTLYSKARPVVNVGNFFMDAIGKAQAEVQALSPSGADGKKAGTTLVSAIIQNDKLYTAAVGDSRIYIIRNGQIRMLTRDHNYYLLLKEQVRKGEITEQEMNMSSQKEALISYLGIPELKLADIMSSPLQLMDGDVVLLCSDGLTKSLTKEEICHIITENADKLQQCADMLTAAAQRKSPRGLDNTSVILLKYN